MANRICCCCVQVLYNFLGSIEVLHPPLSCGFVLPGEGHFMLPMEAALYKLQDPPPVLMPQQAAASGPGAMDLNLGDAILAFMNSPHPLETLGMWQAYGTEGSISRFHNPANYTRALESLSELTATQC